jgi:hypothetical protein
MGERKRGRERIGEHCQFTQQIPLAFPLSLIVIEKFHWSRIPAHVDSTPNGIVSTLPFGTVPESAAPAGRRRRLRRTCNMEPKAGQKMSFTGVF